MRFSDKEMAILLALEMQADEPLSKLAKQLGVRHQTVRYALEKFKTCGLLKGRRCYVNTFALGYSNYALYFSLSGSAQKLRREIISQIKTMPEVGWAAEIGGEFQYACSLSAKHPSVVTEFIDRLSESFGDVFQERALSLRLALHMFPRRYISSRAMELPTLSIGGKELDIDVDDTDRRIMRALIGAKFDSNRELARSLGMHSSTFERRVSKLEEQKLIVGYFYRMNPGVIGMQQHRVLLTAKGNLHQLKTELYQYSFAHPNIRKLIECTGSWDFEIELNTPDGESLRGVTSDIIAKFDSQIARIRSVPVFRQIMTSPVELLRESESGGPLQVPSPS